MKVLVIIIISLLYTLNFISQNKINVDSIYNQNSFLKNCKYTSLTPCERLRFFDSIIHKSQKTERYIFYIIQDFESKTGMKSNLIYSGFLDPFYKSKFDINKDIEKWKTKLNCDYNVKFYYDKQKEDSLFLIENLEQKNNNVLFKKVKLLYDINEYDSAYKVVSYLSEVFQDEMTYYLKGVIELNLSKSDDAIRSLSKCLELNPKNYKALAALGYCYFDKKNISMAEKYCDISLNVNKEYYYSNELKGVILVYQKDYKKAICYLKKSISLNNKSDNSYYNLGLCYLLIGNREKAKKYFEKSKKLGNILATKKLNEI